MRYLDHMTLRLGRRYARAARGGAVVDGARVGKAEKLLLVNPRGRTSKGAPATKWGLQNGLTKNRT